MIGFDDETLNICSLYLAITEIKIHKYNDVELITVSFDCIGYHTWAKQINLRIVRFQYH